MKFLFSFLLLFYTSITFSQSSFTFTFDGDYHYYLDNVEVTSGVSGSIFLENLVVEHNAIIYEIKNYKSCTSENPCESTLIGDRTSLKNNGWSIDFYVKKGDYVLTYINDGFYEVDQYHQSADDHLFGEINGYYFRYNNYKNTPDSQVEDIIIFDDGIWWQDEQNDIYALRKGEQFNGTITDTFKNGYVGFDDSTNEYLWFNYFSENLQADVINTIEVIPEICALKYQPFYKGKKFDYSYEEYELKDGEHIIFYEPIMKKSFIGEVNESVIALDELPMMDSESGNYWMIDENGITYLSLDGGMFDENIEEVNGQQQSFYKYDDSYWAFPDYEEARPLVFYPAVAVK